MSDERLRETERAWQQNPKDSEATQHYDDACRRVGVPSPPRRQAVERLIAALGRLVYLRIRHRPDRILVLMELCGTTHVGAYEYICQWERMLQETL